MTGGASEAQQGLEISSELIGASRGLDQRNGTICHGRFGPIPLSAIWGAVYKGEGRRQINKPYHQELLSEFEHMNLFNPCNNTMRGLLFSSFYK